MLGLVQVLLLLSCLVGHVEVVPDRYILTHARREYLNLVFSVVQCRAWSDIKSEGMVIVPLP